MLMKDGGKKAVSIIVARSMGKDSPDSMKDSNEKFSMKPQNDNGDEMDYADGKKAAAQDILKAIESKDAASLASAISSLVSMCSDEEGEGTEEEEPAPNEESDSESES